MLKERSRKFALQIIKLYTSLPTSTEAQVLGKQVLRSGTSIGAHYYEASHARSNAEFTSKIDLALQEIRETLYWLTLIIEAELIEKDIIDPLLREANELNAIFITISTKVKSKFTTT